MSEIVKLRMSDELIDDINSEFENRRATTVDAMTAHGWDRQAAELEEINGSTSDQILFILKQEVSE